ncbi:hypothetical protein [Candidatus Thiosymbion oneisti]|uniref:hypothetical protein n=1 Tax=Candidatus Thiosymbion oneisti TaxID=589554 RepID=UPI001C4062B4|nr:hypothetical protein [Candidatus Thiosymbion oneisti]
MHKAKRAHRWKVPPGKQAVCPTTVLGNGPSNDAVRGLLCVPAHRRSPHPTTWPAPLVEVMDVTIQNLVRQIAVSKLPGAVGPTVAAAGGVVTF